MRELILAGFGFLGVIFGKEGAAPGAGSVDQPAAIIATYPYFGF